MINEITNSIPHVGETASVEAPHAYGIPFRFDEASWIHLEVEPPLPSGVVLDHAFSEPASEWKTGNGRLVVKTDLSGRILTIARRTPLVQALDLPPNAPLPAQALETTLDQMVMALQDRDVTRGALGEDGGDLPPGTMRALMFPPAEPAEHSTRLPAAGVRKGKLIGFHPATGEMEVRSFPDHVEAELAELRAFSVTQANGGIKVGETGGNSGGAHSITLQAARQEAVRVASGAGAIVIGDSQAGGTCAVAVGARNIASGGEALAVGVQNEVLGVRSAAVGYDNKGASGAEDSTAAGNGNETYGQRSVAAGYRNKAWGYCATAMGANSSANGSGAVAVGYQAAATADEAVAVGHHTKATRATAMALGYRATAETDEAMAVGHRAEVKGDMAVAVGNRCTAFGMMSSAAGWQNHSGGDRSSAHGYGNQAEGEDSSAMGRQNISHGSGSVAMGGGNEVNGTGALACGLDNIVTQDDSAGIGLRNISSHGGVCVGTANMASGTSWAAGAHNGSSGSYVTTAGYSNFATGMLHSAFGYQNYVTGSSCSAVGCGNTVEADESAAFGYHIRVTANQVTEMGNRNRFTGEQARVRADASLGRAAISFGYSAPAATSTEMTPGDEPQGQLPVGMMSFRVSGSVLYIDLNVYGTLRSIPINIPS